MKKQQSKKLPLIVCLALFTCLLSAAVYGAEAGEALVAPPKPPTLEFQPGDEAHHASLDLARFALPLVTLTNNDVENAVQLQLLALDKSGEQRRSLVVEIEAGGSLGVTLEGMRRFASLVVVARGPFVGEVSDLQGERTAALDVRAPHADGGPLQRLLIEHCGGDWTLSCFYPAGCTYVSPAISGEVYQLTSTSPYSVAWNNQYPIGDWLTTNGSCWVNWKESIGTPGCPSRATNCYGERYSVSGVIPF